MKNVWGIVILLLLILAIVGGRLYKKHQRETLRNEQQQVSQNEAFKLLELQKEREIEAQLIEQQQARDSIFQLEQGKLEGQIDELRAIRERLENQTDK
jgi:uncharacterized protein HemX